MSKNKSQTDEGGGGPHSPGFLQICCCFIFIIFRLSSRVPRHSKKMSAPNTNFVLRLRSFRWYGPALPRPWKGLAFRIQACAQAQSANRFTPPLCRPAPEKRQQQQQTRWNNAWRKNTKHITFDCCLLFWFPFHVTRLHWEKITKTAQSYSGTQSKAL